MSDEVEKRELVDLLGAGANEVGPDAFGLGSNMDEATLEQLHEIVDFAERLKEGALIEMWVRERKATGQDARYLEEPPEGYTGYRPKD